MTDYYPLIARTVAALDYNTRESRRLVYEQARQALIRQLRAIEPPLRESEITIERWELERAIRAVERELVRKAQSGTTRRDLLRNLADHIEALLQDEEIQRELDSRNSL